MKLFYHETFTLKVILFGSNFSLYIGNRYFISSAKKNWNDAEQHCVQLKGHLTSIHSKAEDEFLYKELVERLERDFIFLCVLLFFETYKGAHIVILSIYLNNLIKHFLDFQISILLGNNIIDRSIGCGFKSNLEIVIFVRIGRPILEID